MSNIENVIRQLWNDSIEFLHVVCYYDTVFANVTAFVHDRHPLNTCPTRSHD